MRKIFPILFLTMLCGCAAIKTAGWKKIIADEIAKSRSQKIETDWKAKGDVLRTSVYTAINNYKGKVQTSKKVLLGTGIATSAIGTGSTITIAALPSSAVNGKQYVGLGASAGVSVAGFIQTGFGAAKDASNYVSDCNDAVSGWDLNRNQDEDAYYTFLAAVLLINKKYSYPSIIPPALE
jgi:hypothetical protein